MKIYLVPIEPFEQRYTKDWLEWFTDYFTKNKVFHGVIHGDCLVDGISRGRFLDVTGTNFYKSVQLRQICELLHNDHVEDSDVFLFLDLWYPGIEMLSYIKDGLGLKFKIYGCLHAGTYDPFDFTAQMGMGRWGRQLEESWFSLVDGIFVATEFHKKLLFDNRTVDLDKIWVTGFPIYPHFNKKDIVLNHNKKVVFPHRLDPEKNPELFDQLRAVVQELLPSVHFIKTMELWEGDKQLYYDLLKESSVAVSFADQETWGIAMMESVMAGCLPLVPNRLSYQELYDPIFRFDTFDEAIGKLVRMLAPSETFIAAYANNLERLIKMGERAIPNMVKIIERGQG